MIIIAHTPSRAPTQVHDVSRVCNAVATSDLTQKITVPVQGDLMVQLKTVINTMVHNLGHFTTEVRSIARVTTTIVAKGDLSKQIDIAANGEILDLKNTVNGMVLGLHILAVEYDPVHAKVTFTCESIAGVILAYPELIWLLYVNFAVMHNPAAQDDSASLMRQTLS
ncbi:hypothetical protein C8R45DRAFT_1154877 [Mycena sanguinolenta]|nr:hypothetical protein C8R45DRAFT_1154877 [Mycena sanguinolenta]